MKNKISIVTITFNNKENLSRTINSISRQTYSNIEYIIVDGGSTDGSLELIEQNKNIITKYISEPDKGIYDAMNKGLKISTGEFVWFVNAGDEIYSEDTTEKVVKLSENADALYGDVEYVDEKGKNLGTRKLKKPPKKFSYKDMKYGMVVTHQSFVVKRELASEYNIDYKYCSDIDWMISCLKKCKIIINTNLILSKFLVGGFSKKNIISSNKERFIILKNHFGLFQTLLSHIPLSFNFLYYYMTNKKKLY